MCDDEAQAPLLTDRNARDYMTVPGGKTKTKAVPPKAVTMADIFTSQTLVCLLSYTFLSLHSVAFDQVLPVFLHYPTLDPDSDVHLPFQFAGGFGFSSDKIGTISTLYGVACGVIQFQLFPWLCARFGVLACYRLSSAVFPLVYLLTPFTAVLATPPARYAALLLLLLVKGCVVIVGFPCITILLTNSAASLRVLGTLNGYATTLSGVGRALGPAMTGAMFTWGVGRGYIIAPWWLLCAVAAAGAIPPYFIQEGEGPRRADDMDMETETETETAAESEAGPSRSGSDDETRRPASGPLARSPSRK